ncbi:hypothetical protein [Stackebrandtia soli]|uniref:hypothetical protein n=1 Tax=Stackebrandtia soli TaxID=1892856 RepID=UPI0039ED5FFD
MNTTNTLERPRATRELLPTSRQVASVGRVMSAALSAAGSYAGRAGATAVLWWAFTSTTAHPDE